MMEAEHTCMSMRGVMKPGLDHRHRPSSPACSTIRRQARFIADGARARADRRIGARVTIIPFRGGSRRGRGGPAHAPKFDADGLVTCVRHDAASGEC
jgi:hypothetical protein